MNEYKLTYHSCEYIFCILVKTERLSLLQICKLFYNVGSPVFMYIFVSTRNEWYVWRHTQEFLDWVDNKNICWLLLFVVFFPHQSSSLLNLCNRSSVSTTAASTPETDSFEPSVEQLIIVSEFQGNHVYYGLIAAISFLETKKSQGVKPGQQGSWETTAMSLTDKNCCTDKA